MNDIAVEVGEAKIAAAVGVGQLGDPDHQIVDLFIRELSPGWHLQLGMRPACDRDEQALVTCGGAGTHPARRNRMVVQSLHCANDGAT